MVLCLQAAPGPTPRLSPSEEAQRRLERIFTASVIRVEGFDAQARPCAVQDGLRVRGRDGDVIPSSACARVGLSHPHIWPLTPWCHTGCCWLQAAGLAITALSGAHGLGATVPCHHPCVHNAAVPALLSASHPSLLSLLLSRCCQLDPVTPAPSQVLYPCPQQLSAPAALPLSSVCHWAGICARASCWSVRLPPPQRGQEGTLLSCMSQHAAPSPVVRLPARQPRGHCAPPALCVLSTVVAKRWPHDWGLWGGCAVPSGSVCFPHARSRAVCPFLPSLPICWP